jgi:hypothetical protein
MKERKRIGEKAQLKRECIPKNTPGALRPTRLVKEAVAYGGRAGWLNGLGWLGRIPEKKSNEN